MASTEPQAGGAFRLVRAGLDLLDAALAGDDALGRALGHEVAPGWAVHREALPAVRDQVARAADGAAWGPRFFVVGHPPVLVGWGGFKGAPTRGGEVEIGYEVAESDRQRGIATAAARAMVDEAFADPSVTTVVAHTLAGRNISNHLLEGLGFVFEGNAPNVGRPAWRYALHRARLPRR